jgi:hypothetical protein
VWVPRTCLSPTPSPALTAWVALILLHVQTGEVQLRGQFPTWRKDEHRMSDVLKFVKQLFFLRDFGCDRSLALNPAALDW